MRNDMKECMVYAKDRKMILYLDDQECRYLG